MLQANYSRRRTHFLESPYTTRGRWTTAHVGWIILSPAQRMVFSTTFISFPPPRHLSLFGAVARSYVQAPSTVQPPPPDNNTSKHRLRFRRAWLSHLPAAVLNPSRLKLLEATEHQQMPNYVRASFEIQSNLNYNVPRPPYEGHSLCLKAFVHTPNAIAETPHHLDHQHNTPTSARRIQIRFRGPGPFHLHAAASIL